MHTIKVPTPKVKVAVRSEVKLMLGNNSKTTEANLTKLLRKKEHKWKVSCAKKLGSYAQGQGHSQVRDQIMPKLCCSLTTKANSKKFHRKIKNSEKQCLEQD